LCNVIDNWIEKEELRGYEKCFLPYRDSNDKVKGKPNPTLEIFKMDCDTICNSSLILGYYDGPSYDSGIGFELGYAFALGIPIVLVTTDYFQIMEGNNKLCSISPLVSAIATIIHIRNNLNHNLNYRDSQNEILEQIQSRIKETLISLKPVERKDIHVQLVEQLYDIFLDIAFSRTEAGKLLLDRFLSELKANNVSYYIPEETDYTDSSRLINRINSCKKVLIYGDSFELAVDSAIVQGIAYAMGKKIVLYSSDRLYLHQSDDFVLHKNPMIQHSPVEIISTLWLFPY
jgi:nucleoside 2-deoxyribosyltransferase